jgi:hypothetical protein
MLTWPGACPKCFGDLRRNDDFYGCVRVCAECGHRDVAPMLRIPRQPRRRAPLLIRVPARLVHGRRAA